MRWYHYLICCIICIFGIISIIELIDLFNVSSVEYGKVLSIESIQNLQVENDFDLGYLDFESKDNVNYTCEVSQAYQAFNGSEKDYKLMLNGQLAHDVKVSSGKIEGIFTINFYNTDGEKITTSDIEVNIEFLATDTILTFKTQNINDSMSYLNKYFDINGLRLKILLKGD